jgi:long-subunit acyl-CoA synthetase (AMP-forming)
LFLPLSNFQQRYLCYGALWTDFDIILTEYTQLFTAMAKLQPTILLAPPIFYEMIYTEFTRLRHWKRKFQVLAAVLLEFLPVASLRQSMARYFFRDFYKQFGGNIRLLITGMAPIRHCALRFFGMVETGVLAYRPPHAKSYSSVGAPLRDVHFSFRADGEIVVHRKHFVALRYFQCAEGENERTFVGPHQIATGDIGALGKDGHLFLRGRKKELIVTSGGYKIHPEAIEQEINRCLDVANSVLFSVNNDAHLSCIVVLRNPNDDSAKARVRTFLSGLNAARTAMPFVRAIFADQPFSRENGMLRPNMKLDRRRIVAKYGADEGQMSSRMREAKA